MNPADHVGERVTVHGTAHDAHAGAVVVPAGSETPIYVDGLDDWGDRADDEVRVTGVLRPRQALRPGTLVRHGITDEVYVLTEPEVH